MADKSVTNGEYYDHQSRSWMVQCGPTAVAIDKRDANGQPMPPPKTEQEVSSS